MAPRLAGRLIWLVLALVLVGCESKDTPTGTRTAETLSAAQSIQTPDVVDALFLGSGPLIPRDGLTACVSAGIWNGFPRGTAVRVRVSTSVAPAARDAIQRAAGQVGAVTESVIAATTILTDDLNPQPDLNEVTVTARPDPHQDGCPTDGGCVVHTFAGRGAFRSARVVEFPGQTPSGYVQDAVGKGILGLCHIDARRIGGAGNSLMSGGPGVGPGDTPTSFTALDQSAIRAVYTSSLSPGAARRDFLALGLVNLQIGEKKARP